MAVTTTDRIPGREIAEVLGIVRGNSVRARWLGKDLRAAGRTLIGGEMPYYAELLDQSRTEATKRMVEEATANGADAVTVVRYATSMIMTSAAEVLAYGTAVKLQ
jgi:uncharacterized protein YbjQ (UPF0145 family)